MFDVVGVLILSVFLFIPPVLPTDDDDQPICNAPVFADADGTVESAPCLPPEPKPSSVPSHQPWKPV